MSVLNMALLPTVLNVAHVNITDKANMNAAQPFNRHAINKLQFPICPAFWEWQSMAHPLLRCTNAEVQETLSDIDENTWKPNVAIPQLVAVVTNQLTIPRVEMPCF